MKTRDVSIDFLKTFAIVLVVLGHTIQSLVPDFDRNTVFRIIYSFHMPLFMVISGYLAIGSNFSNGYVVKRFTQLVIPYIMWSIVYIVSINIPSISRFDFSFTIPFYKELVKSPDNGGLWFLWVLFLISVIFYIFNKIKHRNLILLSFTLILHILPVLFKIALILGLGFVRWYLPFFLLGTYLKENCVIVKIKWKYIVSLLVVLIGLELIWTRTGVYSFNLELTKLQFTIYNTVINYLVGVIAVLVLFRVFQLFKNQRKEVLWMSSNTLAIYSVHVFVMGMVINLFKRFSGGSFFSIPFVFIITLSVSVLCIMVLKKSAILDKMLFGSYSRNRNKVKDEVVDFF